MTSHRSYVQTRSKPNKTSMMDLVISLAQSRTPWEEILSERLSKSDGHVGVSGGRCLDRTDVRRPGPLWWHHSLSLGILDRGSGERAGHRDTEAFIRSAFDCG